MVEKMCFANFMFYFLMTYFSAAALVKWLKLNLTFLRVLYSVTVTPWDRAKMFICLGWGLHWPQLLLLFQRAYKL